MSGKTIVSLIIKWGALICLILLVRSEFSGNKISKTEFDTMQEKVLAEADNSVMQSADNQMIRRLYGLDPSEYEGVSLSYPISNMGAEEILLVKLKEVSQADTVLAAIESRLATQKKSFDGYGAAQTEMLESSIVDHVGNYILFVSAEDPGSVKNVFESAL